MNDHQQLRETLWKLYQEHLTQFRHYENQRATVTASILAVGIALIGLITFDKIIGKFDLPMTLLLTFLGVFGAFFSAKQYEKAALNMDRARECRTAIDATFVNAPLERIRQAAIQKHQTRFPMVKKLKVHKFWISLYILLALIGFILSVIAVLRP